MANPNFPNNPGYNLYIGARYVPIFDGEWDETKKYEPLTIVQYLGDSYTSKTFVPAGVNPTNETYWVMTSQYNAQVEDLRRDIQQNAEDIQKNAEDIQKNAVDIATQRADFNQLNTHVSELTGNVTQLSNTVAEHGQKITSLEGTTENLDDRVANNTSSIGNINTSIGQINQKNAEQDTWLMKLENLHAKRFIIISDSYGDKTGGGTPNPFCYQIQTRFGSDVCFVAAQAGAGFANGTFLALLQGLAPSVPLPQITDVYFCGGWNDSTRAWNPTPDGISQGMGQCMQWISQNCPFAKGHILFISNGVEATDLDPLAVARDHYLNLGTGNGYSVSDRPSRSIQFMPYFVDDPQHIHPNQAGQNKLANSVINEILGVQQVLDFGSFFPLQAAPNLTFDVDIHCKEIMCDGGVDVYFGTQNSQCLITLQQTPRIEFNGTYFKLSNNRARILHGSTETIMPIEVALEGTQGEHYWVTANLVFQTDGIYLKWPFIRQSKTAHVAIPACDTIVINPARGSFPYFRD